MKLNSICIFFIAGMISAFDLCCANTVDSFKEAFNHKNEKIKIFVQLQKFDPSKHTLSEEHWKIDGVTPCGVDGFEVHPSTEIALFTITWNGHEIPMPIEMYRDCYSPCLNKSDITKYIGARRKVGEALAEEGVMVRWDDKDNMLHIIMVSSEWASAPYQIVWKVTPFGVHSRERILLGS